MSTIDFTLPTDYRKAANARVFPAVVTAVNADNTLNLTMFSAPLSNVPVKYHCHHQHTNHIRRVFLVGDSVLCLYTGEGGNPSNSNLMVLGFGAGMLRDCTLNGFISTPRQYGVNDGYVMVDGYPSAAGDGSLVFPLDDTTNTSQVLAIGQDFSVVAEREEQLYGNIDWISPTGTVLSWKGPPGRSVPFDFTKEIPGLTKSDIQFDPEGPLYYTCFGAKVYSQGEVFATVPTVGDVEPKVLGAALQGTRLVCIVNNHYTEITGFLEEVWINNGASGLYDISTNPKGWEKINTRNGYGRPDSIWAFNQSGTKATQRLSEYTINVAAKSASMESMPPTDITFGLTADPSGKYETKYEGSSTIWSDYKGDVRVFAVVSASGGHVYEPSATTTTTSIQADRYLLVTGECAGYIEITGSQAGAIFTGTCCPCETPSWSISTGTISDTGYIDLDSSCGTAVITYSCGDITLTAEIAMNSGGWEYESGGVYVTGGDTGPATTTLISGNGTTKEVEWAGGMCHAGSEPSSSTTIFYYADGTGCHQSSYRSFDCPTDAVAPRITNVTSESCPDQPLYNVYSAGCGGSPTTVMRAVPFCVSASAYKKYKWVCV